MILICNLRSDVLSVTLVKFNKYVMERIAIFPGSFDPFTIGHEEIVKRGLKMFDKIVIAVGINAVKKEFLDVDTRIAIIRKVFEDVDNVIVMSYSGLTVDFCEQMGANFIIRGLRTAADFEYEQGDGFFRGNRFPFNFSRTYFYQFDHRARYIHEWRECQ